MESPIPPTAVVHPLGERYKIHEMLRARIQFLWTKRVKEQKLAFISTFSFVSILSFYLRIRQSRIIDVKKERGEVAEHTHTYLECNSCTCYKQTVFYFVKVLLYVYMFNKHIKVCYMKCKGRIKKYKVLKSMYKNLKINIE